MAYQDIEIEHRNSVSWLYLNRPKAMNAMSIVTVRELAAAFAELRDRDETRVIVMSGRGKAFCAGADLTTALPSSDGPTREPTFLEEATRMEGVLGSITKPVIAAVNGVCCAGGLEVALQCDFVIAIESAKVGDAHANYGAMPGGGTTARLARLVGLNMAKYILFTGSLQTAKNLEAVGLFVKVTKDDALETTVQELAESIATKSPLGLRNMKALINDAFDLPLALAVKTEKLVSAAHMLSYDAREGGNAFAEKRKPVFRGY